MPLRTGLGIFFECGCHNYIAPMELGKQRRAGRPAVNSGGRSNRVKLSQGMSRYVQVNLTESG
jgi:hypothetical protein